MTSLLTVSYTLSSLDEIYPIESNGVSISFKSNLWCQWAYLKEKENATPEQVFVLFMLDKDELYYISGRPERRYKDRDDKRQFINELESSSVRAFFEGYYLPYLMSISLTSLNLDQSSSVEDIAKTLVEAVFVYKTVLD